MVVRIVDQTSGEEFAPVLKGWRTERQVSKLSTSLDYAAGVNIESRGRRHPTYHFHFDDILARQVQKYLFQNSAGNPVKRSIDAEAKSSGVQRCGMARETRSLLSPNGGHDDGCGSYFLNKQ